MSERIQCEFFLVYFVVQSGFCAVVFAYIILFITYLDLVPLLCD